MNSEKARFGCMGAIVKAWHQSVKYRIIEASFIVSDKDCLNHTRKANAWSDINEHIRHKM